MIKIYHREEIKSDKKYWQDRWNQEELSSPCSLRYNNLIDVLDKFLSRDGKILEGGCGPAHYVSFYRGKGYDIYGFDFDTETISIVKRNNPSMPLVSGNIERLPFKENSFQAHISGGVLEHIEAGPSKALREIRRTLIRDGILIMTVPYINMQDRISCLWNNCRIYDGCFSRNTENFRIEGSNRFYCYAFKLKEISKIVRDAGFKIVLSKRVSIEYGIRKVPFVDVIIRMLKPYFNNDSRGEPIKKIFVKESTSSCVFRMLLGILELLFGTVVLLVCQKEEDKLK